MIREYKLENKNGYPVETSSCIYPADYNFISRMKLKNPMAKCCRVMIKTWFFVV